MELPVSVKKMAIENGNIAKKSKCNVQGYPRINSDGQKIR